MSIKQIDYENIGKRIRKYRQASQLSQTELARQLNRTLRTVQKYESGVSICSMRSLNRMAEIFGVSVECLLFAETEPVIENGKMKRTSSSQETDCTTFIVNQQEIPSL